ncbi:sugar ABC transporter substrate-binding protein [Agathobaculum sp.]|uniref:sugar ABC transporter substrate-binding protein n=1 Tax=Agathobaculum sp. TaxID=2048138 RepID=UPI0027B9D39D|nr:sugar ABC transporter substrate-binding protein [Agathobaculum sp.]
MKTKRLLAALMAGSLMLSMAACSSDTSASSDSGDQASSDGGDGGYRLSMILKTNSSEFWKVIQAGAEAYVEEHPDLVSELSIKGPPSETSYQDQINMIKTDLSDDTFDGYLIAPLQSESVASLIADTEKPVMAFDTDIDSDKCLAFIGTGNKEAAKQGALAAVEAAKAAGWETIQCIEIAGVQGDATNTARMEGYEEGITEAGGEWMADDVQYADATATKAVDAMNGIMGRYPDGVAIICSNNDDMAIAAARTAASNPAYENTIFLGFDGQKSACEAVLSGDLTMTAAQNNFDIGYKAVENMVKCLQGEEYGDVDTSTEIVTADTAQDRLDRFAEWLS